VAGRDKEVADVEFLLVFLADPAPVMTAAEIGEQVGMTRQGGHARLESLEERGFVNSAMKASARVWWLTEDGGRKAARDAQPDEFDSTG
jgi:predicted ArsR family transcriptional regulator